LSLESGPDARREGGESLKRGYLEFESEADT